MLLSLDKESVCLLCNRHGIVLINLTNLIKIPSMAYTTSYIKVCHAKTLYAEQAVTDYQSNKTKLKFFFSFLKENIM